MLSIVDIGLSTGRVESGSGRRSGLGRVKIAKPPQPPPTATNNRVGQVRIGRISGGSDRLNGFRVSKLSSKPNYKRKEKKETRKKNTANNTDPDPEEQTKQ